MRRLFSLQYIVIVAVLMTILFSCGKRRLPPGAPEGWYDCYARGLFCMEKELYDKAISNFDKALKEREYDRRKAGTFGMHFTDYFPHREKGVICYLTGEYDRAKAELELSIREYPSAKAYFYLDDVRKRIMEREKETAVPPRIGVELLSEAFEISGEIWTKADPVIIS